MKNIHTLVIPDVHGRLFWKEAILKFPINEYTNLNIVFLGDYLDPYGFEGITRKQAIENFKEIVDFAKSDNRIHLLIGNHDMHYWYDAIHKSRIDTNPNNCKIIKDIFLQNFTLFNIAYEETINKKRFLYTHAGVTSFWLEHLHFVGKNCLGRQKENRKEFCDILSNMTPTANELNKMKSDFQGQALLWSASFLRGGDDDCGSCLWADYEEWIYENSPIKKIYQVFGHSLAAGGFDEGIIDKKKRIAMLDARQAWIITNKGNIMKLEKYLE